MRLLLACFLALAIPALCVEPLRRQRKVGNGMMYEIIHSVNLNQEYNLVANASLDGSSWNLAMPAYMIKVRKDTVSSSPLQNSALNVLVDSSCGTLHSVINFGVNMYNNESRGTFEDFYTNSYSFPCPIGSWVYDPDNVVASVYFYVEVITEQVPLCPFTLKFASAPSPDAHCAGSHPQWPGGPVPPKSGSGGLSNGAIAGIVIAVCCAVVLVFAIIVVARRRGRSTADYTEPLTDQTSDTAYYAPPGENDARYGAAHTSGHTFA